MSLGSQLSDQISKMAANPRNKAVKKYMADILRHKFPESEEIIDRILSSLTIDKDAQQFATMIGHIYQVSYSQAVEDHRVQLEKLGLKTKIKERP